jgi:hypothetical protein
LINQGINEFKVIGGELWEINFKDDENEFIIYLGELINTKSEQEVMESFENKKKENLNEKY